MVRADAPPHRLGGEGAGAELGGDDGLVDDQGCREGARIIDLDGVAGGTRNIAPVEGDVRTGRKPRIAAGVICDGAGHLECGGGS